MSRYIQEKPSTKSTKTKSTARVLPKPGSYSKKDLEKVQKFLTLLNQQIKLI